MTKRTVSRIVLAVCLLAAPLLIAASWVAPSVGLYWFSNTDPTSGGGVSAPVNQLLIRTDTPSLYYKSGSANTAWTQIGNTGGGGGGQSVGPGLQGNGSIGAPIDINHTATPGQVPVWGGANWGNANPITGGACAVGTAVTNLSALGAITCTAFGDGDITAVNAGTSLSGGGTSGAVTLSVNLPGGTCGASQAVTSLNSAGTASCTTVGDITSVTAGTSLTGGGTSGDIALNVNLPGGTCSAGQAATSLSSAGTLTCSTNVATVAGGDGISVSTSSGTATVAINTATSGVTGGAAPAYGYLSYNGTNTVYIRRWANDSHHVWEWADNLDNTGAVFEHVTGAVSNSGTFACTSAAPGHPGTCLMSTASNAAGVSRLTSNLTGIALDATNAATVEWTFTIPTLCDDDSPTNANPCQIFVGFGDNSTGPAQTDGVGLVYNPVTALTGAAISQKWQIETANGGSRTYKTLDGTGNTVDSPVQVGSISGASGTVYVVKETCTAGPSGRCDICINDTAPGVDNPCTSSSAGAVGSICGSASCSITSASNIPAASNSNLFGVALVINKTAGTTVARTVQVDKVSVYAPF